MQSGDLPEYYTVDLGAPTWLEANGVRHACWTSGTGQELVLLHGHRSGAHGCAQLVSRFVKDFRVVVFDQRGSGRTDVPPGPYSTSLLADDAAALLAQLGVRSACVLGVSMGGTIAQELALRHPSTVRSLVLVSTGPGGERELRAQRRVRTDASAAGEEEVARERARTLYSDSYIEARPRVIQQIMEAERVFPSNRMGLQLRAAARRQHDAFDRLPSITVPTLVLAGREDRLIPWQNSVLLAEQIPGAGLHVIPGLGHGLHYQEPDLVHRLVTEFLRSAVRRVVRTCGRYSARRF